jgi:DNA invertase Pin-like site-specific DNA recombinase
MAKTGQIGTYIRPSTNQQDDQHQHDSIDEYVDNHDLPSDRVEQFVDIESGANDDREQFNKLLNRIRNDEFDHVIVWEISRISRDGATLQQSLTSFSINSNWYSIPIHSMLPARQ